CQEEAREAEARSSKDYHIQRGETLVTREKADIGCTRCPHFSLTTGDSPRRGLTRLSKSPKGRSVMNQQPVAFMSYIHEDDNHDRGFLTQFRERLTGEIRIQIGQEFLIFQDRKDIQWGQNWKKRIEESLDEVMFFIPILTPGFFKSKYCRAELR